MPNLLRVLWERHRAVLDPVRDVRDLVQLAYRGKLLGDRARLVEQAPDRPRELRRRLLEQVQRGEGDWHGRRVLDRTEGEDDLQTCEVTGR